MNKRHYTQEELAAALVTDLLNDAECAERQAAEGPYFMDNVGRKHFQPERVPCVTDADREQARAELLAYAAKCRARAAR